MSFCRVNWRKLQLLLPATAMHFAISISIFPISHVPSVFSYITSSVHEVNGLRRVSHTQECLQKQPKCWPTHEFACHAHLPCGLQENCHGTSCCHLEDGFSKVSRNVHPLSVSSIFKPWQLIGKHQIRRRNGNFGFAGVESSGIPLSNKYFRILDNYSGQNYKNSLGNLKNLARNTISILLDF